MTCHFLKFCFDGEYGEVAEWFKAAICKDCYTVSKAVSEVRILPLSATFDNRKRWDKAGPAGFQFAKTTGRQCLESQE